MFFFLSRTQVVAAFGAVLLALYVLDLVRRRRLSEEYSLLWVIASVVIAVLGFSTRCWWDHARAGSHGRGLDCLRVRARLRDHDAAVPVAQAVAARFENHALTRELALLRHDFEESRARTGGGGRTVNRALQFAIALGSRRSALWLSMKEVDLARVADSLRNANYLGFTAVMGAHDLRLLVRAIAGGCCCRWTAGSGPAACSGATMIGSWRTTSCRSASASSCARGALARREKLSKSMALATIVVERAIDMLTLLAIFGIALLVSPIARTRPRAGWCRAARGCCSCCPSA